LVRRLGIVSIGQTPRPDLEHAFRRHAGNVDVVVSGVLDRYSREAIVDLTRLPSNFPLRTRLSDGTIVDVGIEAVAQDIPSIAAGLADRGATAVVIACTGEFTPFPCTVPVLLPFLVVPAVAMSLSRTRKIGVVTSNDQQQAAVVARWEKLGFSVHATSATPFAEEGMEPAAAELSDPSLEFVVLDCMGHDEAFRTNFARLSGRPVLAAQSLCARVAAELVGASHASA
jgi:protein AroM